MRFILLVLSITLAHSASAQARVPQYQGLKDKLAVLNPLKDADVMKAVPLVGQVDAEIEKFSQAKVQRSDEFASLVLLAGYALPLGLAAESMETITDIIRTRHDLRSAFADSVKSLDTCRGQYLLSESKVSNGGLQDGKAAEKSAIAKPGDFDYASCVAKQPKQQKR